MTLRARSKDLKSFTDVYVSAQKIQHSHFSGMTLKWWLSWSLSSLRWSLRQASLEHLSMSSAMQWQCCLRVLDSGLMMMSIAQLFLETWLRLASRRSFQLLPLSRKRALEMQGRSLEDHTFQSVTSSPKCIALTGKRRSARLGTVMPYADSACCSKNGRHAWWPWLHQWTGRLTCA